MYEERPDSRILPERIEQSVLAAGCPIASEQGLALAPPTAAGDLDCPAAARGVDHKIRSVRDELAVYAEYRAQRAFYLGLRIVPRLQRAYGQLDQRVQRRHVGQHRPANVI